MAPMADARRTLGTPGQVAHRTVAAGASEAGQRLRDVTSPAQSPWHRRIAGRTLQDFGAGHHQTPSRVAAADAH